MYSVQKSENELQIYNTVKLCFKTLPFGEEGSRIRRTGIRISLFPEICMEKDLKFH